MISPLFYSLFGRFDARRPPCADGKRSSLTETRRGRAAKAKRPPVLKLNRQGLTKRELGPQSLRESKLQKLRLGRVAEGEILWAAAYAPTRGHVLPPSEVSAANAQKFKAPLRSPACARPADLRAMNPAELNTHAAPQWRTTHARVLRARRRLRQLHRRRHAKLSRNG